MRIRLKRAAALVLALGLVLALSACSGGREAHNIKLLVQGNIDAVYKGIFDADYMKLVGSNQTQEEEDYHTGLEREAEYFANYWGIISASKGEALTDLDDSLVDGIISLYKQIYSQAKYEIQDPVKRSDGSYTVQILIQPIDIMEKADELYENYQPLNDFYSRTEEVDWNNLSDEEYLSLTNEYGRIILDLVNSKLPELGYLEEESLSMQIAKDSDGYFTMNDSDWQRLDLLLLSYPS